MPSPRRIGIRWVTNPDMGPLPGSMHRVVELWKLSDQSWEVGRIFDSPDVQGEARRQGITLDAIRPDWPTAGPIAWPDDRQDLALVTARVADKSFNWLPTPRIRHTAQGKPVCWSRTI